MDRESIEREFGVDSESLIELTRTGTIFHLSAPGQGEYYPRFLFDPHFQGLSEVLMCLRGLSAWQKWYFLTKPSFRLGGIAPVDALQDPSCRKIVLALAIANAQG